MTDDPLPPELDAVARTMAARLDADSDFTEAVVAARAAGHTLEAIGDACGLTRQRIQQIVKDHLYPTLRG